ncbi:LacI family transcriptional regulator [Streptomyces badius]
MASLLDRGERPDAVFAYNDLIAIGAMRTITEHGLAIPDDIAVVGFDDIEESRYGATTLTTIAPDKAAIARLAVDSLVERLAGTQVAEPRRPRPGYRLVVRESTTPRETSGPPS